MEEEDNIVEEEDHIGKEEEEGIIGRPALTVCMSIVPQHRNHPIIHTP